MRLLRMNDKGEMLLAEVGASAEDEASCSSLSPKVQKRDDVSRIDSVLGKLPLRSGKPRLTVGVGVWGNAMRGLAQI